MMISYSSLLSLDLRVSTGADSFRLRFSDNLALAVSPKGVWAAPLPLTPAAIFTPLAMPPGEIKNLYVLGSRWILLKSPEPQNDHSILISNDSGRTFTPIDRDLLSRGGTQPYRLVPTRLSASNGVMAVNAGGGINLFASADGGRSWVLLSGSYGTQMCSPGKVFIANSDVVVGGECPLDIAYLRKGVLNDFRTGWQVPLRDVAPGDIGNRNVQFIEPINSPNNLLAGVEGGLLASDDGGDSWQWALKFESAPYPYIQQVCHLPEHDLTLVGGFDKANDARPFLAMKTPSTAAWRDVSENLMSNSSRRDVLALVRDPDGRCLVATYDEKRSAIEIGILSFA